MLTGPYLEYFMNEIVEGIPALISICTVWMTSVMLWIDCWWDSPYFGVRKTPFCWAISEVGFRKIEVFWCCFLKSSVNLWKCGVDMWWIKTQITGKMIFFLLLFARVVWNNTPRTTCNRNLKIDFLTPDRRLGHFGGVPYLTLTCWF